MAAVGRLIDTQKGQATERAERESVCMCVGGVMQAVDGVVGK